MEDELKPKVTSEVVLPDVDPTYYVSPPLNEIKKEYSLSEPNSHGEFLEHVFGSTYAGMDLKLEMDEKVKPEAINEVWLPAVADSASDVLDLNKIKKECLISETHLHYGCVEHVDGGVVQNRIDNELVAGPSPPRKRNKMGHLSIQEKNMILNVYKGEMRENSVDVVHVIVNKVANKTGVCCASVYNVIREYKDSHTFSAPRTNHNRKKSVGAVDEFDKNEIRRKVHQFYFNNEMPTMDKVLKEVNADNDLPNFKRTTFYKLLTTLNFKYHHCGRNSMLLDKDNIVIWRRNYLKKIKSYRNENRKIYYLDETWINTGHTKSYAGKGQRLVICHIGSEDGFVPDALWAFESKQTWDYHEEIVDVSFENWFSNVLPKLADNAVIVLDNAPYHSRKLEKIPTSTTNKADIKNWLSSKNISFQEELLKVELLDIVKKHKQPYNKYIIDEMASNHNKIVLRLPPYHCELNPIELIWAEIKNYGASRNATFKFADFQNLIYEAVQAVTQETWQKCIQHVREQVETKMWLLDNIIENYFEPLIINLNPNDSSSDFSE